VQVARHAGDSRWAEYRRAFGDPALDFFRWQENAADALWDLALRLPPWPPQTPQDAAAAVAAGLPWLLQGRPPSLAVDALRPVAARLPQDAEALRLFVDGQLLISAQTESRQANALYGAAALDLPRRGIAHLAGGMGAIAETLVEAVRRNGGRVLYRQQVTRIRRENGRPVAVETRRGGSFPADLVIANLTPWNAAGLLEGEQPAGLRRLPPRPSGLWGAFVLYVGIDGASIPPDFALHHQVLLRRPLGEGNSVFLSLSPEWDAARAPAGHRALTISTHTALDGWWELYERDRPAYEARKNEYEQKALAAAEVACPDCATGQSWCCRARRSPSTASRAASGVGWAASRKPICCAPPVHGSPPACG
jgi:phytoene dehydrogenase-like protein